MLKTTLWIVVVVVLSAGTATAGDDSDCELVLAITPYPADGAIDVPLNPMFVLEDRVYNDQVGSGQVAEDELYVVDSTGYEVMAYFDWLTGDCVTVYEPHEELQPDTTYEVRNEGEETLLTFTTGTVLDQEAPHFELGEDGDGEGVAVSFTASDDVVLITGKFGIEDGTRGIGMSPPANGIINLNTDGYVSNGYLLDLTAHDWSGNTTEVVLTVRSPVTDDDSDAGDDVDETEPQDCLCSSSSLQPTASSAIALGILAVLVVIRRRY